MTDQDLAGLSEYTRRLLDDMLRERADRNEPDCDVLGIRAELLRLAREAEHQRDLASYEYEARKRAEAELAAIKETPTGSVLDWALRRAEKDEAELAALKREIAEAPTALVQCLEGIGGSNPAPIVLSTSSIILGGDLIGQRVALLPVGGE